MHLDIVNMITTNIYIHQSHWYSTATSGYIDTAHVLHAHTYAVVKSLARDRTAFYTCSERQDELYAKLTALTCFYRLCMFNGYTR